MLIKLYLFRNEVERSKSEVTEKRYLRKESSLSRKNQLDTMDERSTDKQSVTVERDDSVQDVETSSLSRLSLTLSVKQRGDFSTSEFQMCVLNGKELQVFCALSLSCSFY